MKICHLNGHTLGELTGVRTGAIHSHYGVPQPPRLWRPHRTRQRASQHLVRAQLTEGGLIQRRIVSDELAKSQALHLEYQCFLSLAGSVP